ncbi:hypothetical protein [Muriicola sp.]|uniref:hypothetical protein n=1 Tax=Muriicola sp. TaxID=2020856 RepID=UPI003C76978E
MSTQNPLTLVTPIKDGHLEHLYSYLKKVKYELEANKHELFERTKNIHYLRWLIIDDKQSSNPHTIFFKHDKESTPQLVFSSNFDGSVDAHLEDLSADVDGILDTEGNPYAESHLIDTVYGCCIGYPEEGERTPATRKEFFKKYMVKTSAFYQGSPGRTVVQILRENKLRNYLKDLIDAGSWDPKLTPREIHQYLKKQVASNDDFSGLQDKTKLPRRNWLKFILFILLVIPLLPVIIIWVLIVQYFYEEKDEYYVNTRSDIDKEKIKVLEEYEDLGTEKDVKGKGQLTDLPPVYYQNQFSQLVDMKPGKVRLITFKAMMLLARVLISSLFVRGKLMGIPTIHFARWVLFDDNKRVLFFSNFDGSWQQYLGDFIDESGWGLTGIFSNTTVFPKSRFLGFTGVLAKKKFISTSHFLFPGGAYDEEHFLAWSRDSELSTQIWYSAYPELSIKNVNNNSRLCYLLSKDLSERGARRFFELI